MFSDRFGGLRGRCVSENCVCPSCVLLKERSSMMLMAMLAVVGRIKGMKQNKKEGEKMEENIDSLHTEG